MVSSSASPLVHLPPGRAHAEDVLKDYDIQSPVSMSSNTSRSSFASVRETDSDLVQLQSFTTSKISSYTQACEDAIDSSPSPTSRPGTPKTLSKAMQLKGEFITPLTQPHSQLHGAWLGESGQSTRRWKKIEVRGKIGSSSHADLQLLNASWSSPSIIAVPKKPEVPQSTISRLEQLPMELLVQIFAYLFVETPTNSITTRNADLLAVLLTCKTTHSATVLTLYNHITIPHSKIFRKFLAAIRECPDLGNFVKILDFNHFNPSAIFTTARERAQTQNLTKDTLLECLNLMPGLRNFLGQEHISEDLSTEVLEKLFFGLPNLQGLDFAGCSDVKFRDAFAPLLTDDDSEWPDKLPIQRLSFHKCMILPTSLYDTILPRLPKLTHLDLTACRVTDSALMSIPQSARLTHLNLSKAALLTAEGVINFLTQHPACRSLVYLSLSMDITSHQLFQAHHITELLPLLPSTLRSLSLKGAEMCNDHVPLIEPLLSQLEELTLGTGIDAAVINNMVASGPSHYNASHTLKYLDVSDLFGAHELNAFFHSYQIFKAITAPLEVIEVSEKVYQRVKNSPRALKDNGWHCSDQGYRYWLVRDAKPSNSTPFRWWKMGASFWGMRKVPVYCAEVGGIYGSFMFSRRL